MSLVKKASKKTPPPPINLLMAAALETWCHHLLYVRRVYPSSTFCDSYFLGIRYKANRHPGVVEYISNAISVAVPALIGRVADEFCLEVVEEQTTEKDGDDDADINSKQQTHTGEKLKPLQFSSSQSNNTTPSNSQEEEPPPPKRRRSSSPQRPNKKLDIKPSALFHNHKEETQQSLSSLSSTGKGDSQDTHASSKTNENESAPLEESQQQQQQQQQIQQPEENQEAKTMLAYKSVMVLEKFSLYFSPSSLDEEEDSNNDASTLQDVEDLGQKPKAAASLFTTTSNRRRRSASKQPKGPPTAEELQEQAIIQELERGFRNLILNMTSLKRDRVLPSDYLNFRLILHVNHRQRICPEIENALDVGSWYPCSTTTETTTAASGTVSQKKQQQPLPHMPLYQVVVSDWDIGFHMQRRQAP